MTQAWPRYRGSYLVECAKDDRAVPDGSKCSTLPYDKLSFTELRSHFDKRVLRVLEVTVDLESFYL